MLISLSYSESLVLRLDELRLHCLGLHLATVILVLVWELLLAVRPMQAEPQPAAGCCEAELTKGAEQNRDSSYIHELRNLLNSVADYCSITKY